MPPVEAVTVRLPPTLDAARSTAVVLTRVALPVVPAVLAARLPVTASWLARMSALLSEVVKLALPPTVMAPSSVRLPSVAVAVRLPPTLDVARVSAVALTMVAWPAAPCVLTAIVPSTAWVLTTMVVPAVEAV